MSSPCRWFWMLALALPLVVAGCGETVKVIQIPGGGTGTGSGGGAWDPIPTENGSLSCDAIVTSLTAGAPCESNETCGQGGRCITTSAGSRVCAQVCFPEDDSCDTCSATEECTRLLDPSGQVVRFDLNSDGTPETIAGACQSREVVGDRGLFETCSEADGACQSGLVCVQATGASAGTCLQACEGACDNFEGVLPTCSATTLDTDVCIIACSTDADSELPACPAGLTCTDVAMGNQACLR